MQVTKQDLLALFITEGEDWEPGIIQTVLKRKGSPIDLLEQGRGVKPGVMRNVFYRPCKSYELEIATVIGVSPAVIWPSRYQDKNPQVVAV